MHISPGKHSDSKSFIMFVPSYLLCLKVSEYFFKHIVDLIQSAGYRVCISQLLLCNKVFFKKLHHLFNSWVFVWRIWAELGWLPVFLDSFRFFLPVRRERGRQTGGPQPCSLATIPDMVPHPNRAALAYSYSEGATGRKISLCQASWSFHHKAPFHQFCSALVAWGSTWLTCSQQWGNRFHCSVGKLWFTAQRAHELGGRRRASSSSNTALPSSLLSPSPAPQEITGITENNRAIESVWTLPLRKVNTMHQWKTRQLFTRLKMC